MIARAEAYEAAVTLLRDLEPYEQCRQIVQMVYDGSLTQQQGNDLLSVLVDYESIHALQTERRGWPEHVRP